MYEYVFGVHRPTKPLLRVLNLKFNADRRLDVRLFGMVWHRDPAGLMMNAKSARDKVCGVEDRASVVKCCR